MEIIILLFATQWRQHIGLSAFWAFNTALSIEAMGCEHIIEKAHLEVLVAFRTPKMMTGGFDCESNRVKDNNDNQHKDNNYDFIHEIFLLKKFVS